MFGSECEACCFPVTTSAAAVHFFSALNELSNQISQQKRTSCTGWYVFTTLTFPTEAWTTKPFNAPSIEFILGYHICSQIKQAWIEHWSMRLHFWVVVVFSLNVRRCQGDINMSEGVMGLFVPLPNSWCFHLFVVRRFFMNICDPTARNESHGYFLLFWVFATYYIALISH